MALVWGDAFLKFRKNGNRIHDLSGVCSKSSYLCNNVTQQKEKIAEANRLAGAIFLERIAKDDTRR